APGSVLPPNAELAQYLLMKVVAGASTGNHRTALGTDLTGCYTTLWQSQEGRKAIEAAGCSPALSKVLQTATGFNGDAPNRLDRDHPKLRQVVAETMRRWDHGEKTLIFCFRVPTAETLHRILNEQVEQRLRVARRELFKTRGTEVGDEAEADRAMQQFRRSFTARDSSGVSLFLDRVLLGWLQLHDLPSPELRESDRLALATLYARARIGGRPLLQDRNPRLDRVFLNRVLEHVWAGRLLTDGTAWRKGLSKTACEDGERLLRAIANERWVRFRYGLDERADIVPDWDGDADSIQATSHAAAAAQYELVDEVSSDAVRRIAELLRVGDRGSRHDWLGSGPNLFTPLGLERTALRADATGRIDEMRRLLFSIAAPTERGRWQERAKVLDAVTRALLRDDVLLRMPKSVFKDDDTTWAMSLLRGLHEPPKGGGREPLAERLKLFLTELAAMGPKERDAHLSYATNARASAVALVTGSAGSADRESIFNGFNTPMLPDVLVCTSVGQEGIDLHRHCRHVVHYDLGWNPATLEQRTGRTDRLGSLALRERANAIAERLSSSEHPRDSSPSESRLPSLDVALPYLAGTYDERMYEVLRSRAQTFDILTGGDPAAQRAADSTWLEPDDPGAPGDASFVPLPPEMLERLRVNLAVADD
ncbi:MAG TPA: helicase-related protein, partial [Pirellulales bacterium]